MGYKFSKLFMLQTGFIWQFDYRTSDNGSGKNYIQTSVLFTLNRQNASMVVTRRRWIDATISKSSKLILFYLADAPAVLVMREIWGNRQQYFN